MTEDARRIEYLKLEELRADPRNPKAHDRDAIAHSVERFGFMEPIVLDERTGFIVSGHGRVETLTRMRADGKPAPEGVRVTKRGGWRVPVVAGWRSSSDLESGAALIALNRTVELGGWVDDALLDLLHELGDAEVDGLDDAARFDAPDLDERPSRSRSADPVPGAVDPVRDDIVRVVLMLPRPLADALMREAGAGRVGQERAARKWLGLDA